MIPLLLATGIGSEVQRPLATVVVGGLVTSMTINEATNDLAFMVTGAARRAFAAGVPWKYGPRG